MQTFLVYNEITPEIIKQLTRIKVAGVLSLHTPSQLESILTNFKDGDTLIIEGIHIFNGAFELYSALCLISNLSNGHFISLQQRILKIDSGQMNKDALEVVEIGARLEETCSKNTENYTDNNSNTNSIKKLKQLCMRILEDAFQNQTISN